VAELSSSTIFSMKSFSAAATAVVGAALLVKSAYADVDPIVIKV
jgi:hypothetical protein